MNRYNATYYCNANEYPAEVSLERNRLCIRFGENDKPNLVYWYYEQTQKSKHSSSTFEYPGYPLQTLLVLDADLVASIQTYCEESRRKVVRNRMRPVLIMFAAVVAFLLLAYAFGVPWLAGKLANDFPLDNEKALGQQLFASVKSGFDVDEKRTAYLNAFFDELRIPSRYDVQITVVKSETANAFAVPGGHIVVFDKVLQGMTSYEELAALLAHEFVHVENRHSLRSLFRRLGGYLFFSFLLGDIGEIGGVLVRNAEDLKNLSYSRGLEKEADEEGTRLLVQRNIDCKGFVQLFRGLKKQNPGPQPAEWLSSHPDLEKRIRNIQKNNSCRNAAPKGNEVLHALFLKIQIAD